MCSALESCSGFASILDTIWWLQGVRRRVKWLWADTKWLSWAGRIVRCRSMNRVGKWRVREREDGLHSLWRIAEEGGLGRWSWERRINVFNEQRTLYLICWLMSRPERWLVFFLWSCCNNCSFILCCLSSLGVIFCANSRSESIQQPLEDVRKHACTSDTTLYYDSTNRWCSSCSRALVLTRKWWRSPSITTIL